MIKICLLLLLYFNIAYADNCKFVGAELIYNGSFDNDFDGFYSQYSYLANPPMALNKKFTITNDPASFLSGWITFDDKSPSSNGKMFLAAGSEDTTFILIRTNASVKKNTFYLFSCWVASVNYVSPPKIKVLINDEFQISEQISSIAGDWKNIVFEWFSGDTETADIKLFDVNRQPVGNDFVVDEISLKECFPEIPVPKIFCNNVICEGDDLMLFADSIAGAIYFWSGPDNFNSNNRNPVIKNAKTKNSGTYYLYFDIEGMVSDTVYIDVTISKNFISPDDSSLVYLGTAVRKDEYIKLTDSKKIDMGAVWFKKRFSVKNDFVTTFEFLVKDGSNGIVNEKSIPGADGFAFVIHNNGKPSLGQKGGDMGYTGITNSLAIEYDMFKNPYDPNGNHIAVQSMGTKPNIANHLVSSSTLAMNDTINIIRQNTLYYSKIEYLWNSKTFNVYFGTDSLLTTPVIKLNNLDLTTFLNLEDGENIFVGFTAGTGEAFQEHNIVNWVVPCIEPTNVGVDDKFDFGHILKISISPNPVNEKFEIDFDMSYYAAVNLTLFDLTGKVIKNILENELTVSGHHKIQVLTGDFGQGMYLLKLQTPTEQIIQKVLIIK